MPDVKCEKCGKTYEIGEGESPKDYECSQCGGDLKYISSDDISADDKDISKKSKIGERLNEMRERDSSKKVSSSSSSGPGIIKQGEDWFHNKSTPIKLGIGVGVCCIGVIIIIGIFGLLSPDAGPLSGAELEQFKASCKTISFDQLDKNPDSYAGQNVKFTGEIVQISEYGDSTEMRVSVTQTEYGFWSADDVIFVTYEKKTGLVKDNIITIYGTVEGSYTYTSIIGAQITVPKIVARHIELVKEKGDSYSSTPSNLNISSGDTSSSDSSPSSCTGCGGDGWIDCSACGGSGYDQNGTVCPVCGGTGGHSCEICGGDGIL